MYPDPGFHTIGMFPPNIQLSPVTFTFPNPITDAPSKFLISGPLVPDGIGGLESIPDVGEGPYIAIGVRNQHWAFEISITKGEDGTTDNTVSGPLHFGNWVDAAGFNAPNGTDAAPDFALDGIENFDILFGNDHHFLGFAIITGTTNAPPGSTDLTGAMFEITALDAVDAVIGSDTFSMAAGSINSLWVTISSDIPFRKIQVREIDPVTNTDQYFSNILTDAGVEQVYVDALPSLYELSPFFEGLETGVGCPNDGTCDGIGEHPDCPVTVTPPSRSPSGETLIAIEPDLTGESCTTTVYVKLRKNAEKQLKSCPTAAIDDGSLIYTFPFNDGVQGFDATTNEFLAGPFDPIRLVPVGCL
jgi:hypothetical protein